MSLESVLSLAENLCCEISVNQQGGIDCCEISVNQQGGIDLEGDPQNIEALTPAVLASKKELVLYLKRPDIPSTGPCLICGVPLDQDGGDCWHRAFHMQAVKPPPEAAKAPTIIEQARANISPVALSWLRENKVQLRKQGWRPSELWRRNKSKGIAWAGVWDLPGLSVTIESAGSLSFHFLTATGQTIKQTAWPKRTPPKRSTKK